MVTVRTNASREDVTALIRSLPGILSGRKSDVAGIGEGFRARIGFALYGLIGERFQKMGKGGTDLNGDKWALLTKNYLAYGRPWGGKNKRLANGRRVPQGGKLAGGSGKDGLLTKKQDKEWWNVYRQQLRPLISRMELKQAKSIAAARTWEIIKAQGGKTKIGDPRLGERKLGQYQILKDNGTLETSLSPGVLVQNEAAAEYQPTEGQIFEQPAGAIIVGTKVPYAGFHHFGRGRRSRTLWPEPIPDSWWDEILGVAMTGLERISAVIGGAK